MRAEGGARDRLLWVRGTKAADEGCIVDVTGAVKKSGTGGRMDTPVLALLSVLTKAGTCI